MVHEEVRVHTLWEDGIKNKATFRTQALLRGGWNERPEEVREGRLTLSFDDASFILLE